MLPCFAEAGELIRLTQLLPNCGLINSQMASATTPHEFAIGYLARWYMDEHKPDMLLSHSVARKGVALAEELMHQLGVLMNAKEFQGETLGLNGHTGVKQRKMHVPLPRFFDALVTPVKSNGGYYEGDGKDVAKQKKEWRERNGSTFVGERFIRPKEKCGRFDSRRPGHYGKVAYIRSFTLG